LFGREIFGKTKVGDFDKVLLAFLFAEKQVLGLWAEKERSFFIATAEKDKKGKKNIYEPSSHDEQYHDCAHIEWLRGFVERREQHLAQSNNLG
jgi:hypothetical protein